MLSGPDGLVRVPRHERQKAGHVDLRRGHDHDPRREQEQGCGGGVRRLDGVAGGLAKKLEIDKPYASNASTDLSHLSEMEQRLGKAMADAGSFTFMHVDHGTPPAISDKFLDGVQGVLAGAMSPEEAMQADGERGQRVRGKIKT